MDKPHHKTTAALTVLALLGLAGCSASHPKTTSVKTVITLSNDVTSRTLPTTTVTLRVDESFAVQHLISDGSRTWTQTSAGAPRILRPVGSVIPAPCPTGVVGCSTPAEDVYTAKAPGTTTVVWSFVSLEGCPARYESECGTDTKTIRVVVR